MSPKKASLVGVEAGPGEITAVLQKWRCGDPDALDALLPMVYQELRQLAQHLMLEERREHTLQATALVHEAYLRLSGKSRPRWEDRAHFFAVAAQAMRRVLIDHARRLRGAKRGSGRPTLSLDDAAILTPDTAAEFVALDDSLGALGEFDPRLLRVVELRFFAGMTVPEIARVLDLSPATIKRDWRTAKAWLYSELNEGVDE